MGVLSKKIKNKKDLANTCNYTFIYKVFFVFYLFLVIFKVNLFNFDIDGTVEGILDVFRDKYKYCYLLQYEKDHKVVYIKHDQFRDNCVVAEIIYSTHAVVHTIVKYSTCNIQFFPEMKKTL